MALPEAHWAAPRDFQHHVPAPVQLDGVTIWVFLGSLVGQTSPVTTLTPLLAAEISLDPQARVSLDLDLDSSTAFWSTPARSPWAKLH